MKLCKYQQISCTFFQVKVIFQSCEDRHLVDIIVFFFRRKGLFKTGVSSLFIVSVFEVAAAS